MSPDKIHQRTDDDDGDLQEYDEVDFEEAWWCNVTEGPRCSEEAPHPWGLGCRRVLLVEVEDDR